MEAHEVHRHVSVTIKVSSFKTNKFGLRVYICICIYTLPYSELCYRFHQSLTSVPTQSSLLSNWYNKGVYIETGTEGDWEDLDIQVFATQREPEFKLTVCEVQWLCLCFLQWTETWLFCMWSCIVLFFFLFFFLLCNWKVNKMQNGVCYEILLYSWLRVPVHIPNFSNKRLPQNPGFYFAEKKKVCMDFELSSSYFSKCWLHHLDSEHVGGKSLNFLIDVWSQGSVKYRSRCNQTCPPPMLVFGTPVNSF